MNIVVAIPRKRRCLYGGHDKMSWNYGFIETTTKIYLRCKIKGNRKKNRRQRKRMLQGQVYRHLLCIRICCWIVIQQQVINWEFPWERMAPIAPLSPSRKQVCVLKSTATISKFSSGLGSIHRYCWTRSKINIYRDEIKAAVWICAHHMMLRTCA